VNIFRHGVDIFISNQ